MQISAKKAAEREGSQTLTRQKTGVTTGTAERARASQRASGKRDILTWYKYGEPTQQISVRTTPFLQEIVNMAQKNMYL